MKKFNIKENNYVNKFNIKKIIKSRRRQTYFKSELKSFTCGGSLNKQFNYSEAQFLNLYRGDDRRYEYKPHLAYMVTDTVFCVSG